MVKLKNKNYLLLTVLFLTKVTIFKLNVHVTFFANSNVV